MQESAGRSAAIIREKLDKADLLVYECTEGTLIRVLLILHPHRDKTLHQQKDYYLLKAQMLVSIFLCNKVFIIKVCTLLFFRYNVTAHLVDCHHVYVPWETKTFV